MCVLLLIVRSYDKEIRQFSDERADRHAQHHSEDLKGDDRPFLSLSTIRVKCPYCRRHVLSSEGGGPDHSTTRSNDHLHKPFVVSTAAAFSCSLVEEAYTALI